MLAFSAHLWYNSIYHEEKQLKELSPEERYEQRLAKVKPLLDKFFAWLETLLVSGKSKLSDAVNYALNEKKYIYTFLEDGNIPIDNNRAENAIRPFTIGRKNWLFSNTANGAKCTAELYSVISTAQANGLDVESYLSNLFTELPKLGKDPCIYRSDCHACTGFLPTAAAVCPRALPSKI